MRFYEAEGKELPSVTTIIHILGSDRLMQWANIMGYKRKSIQSILEESTEYGTFAHEIMRTVIDPTAPPASVNIPAKYMIRLKLLENKFRAFARENQLNILKTEFQMISPSLGYGGTMDMFGSISYKGKKYDDLIIDFKTAKQVHSTMWLQMGGYYHLCIEHGFEPKGAGIIRLNDDAIRFNTIDISELKAYSEAFLHLKKFYDFWGNRD